MLRQREVERGGEEEQPGEYVENLALRGARMLQAQSQAHSSLSASSQKCRGEGLQDQVGSLASKACYHFKFIATRDFIISSALNSFPFLVRFHPPPTSPRDCPPSPASLTGAGKQDASEERPDFLPLQRMIP